MDKSGTVNRKSHGDKMEHDKETRIVNLDKFLRGGNVQRVSLWIRITELVTRDIL